MRLSGGLTGVKVSLNAVRTEMGEKAIKKGMLTYGWATFGQWVRCACLEKFVEQGATGNDVWIMLSAVSFFTGDPGLTVPPDLIVSELTRVYR